MIKFVNIVECFNFDCLFYHIYSILLQKMAEERSKSPQNLLKRSVLISSPNNSKSRAYLPSRYAQQRKTDKVGFQDILNSIQVRTSGDKYRQVAENSPKFKGKNQGVGLQRKALKTSNFKSRPMKREKSDEIHYNEIFLNPRQEALEELKKKSCLQDNIKTISKQYEKLLKFDDDQKLGSSIQQKQSEDLNTQQSFDHALQLLSQQPSPTHASSSCLDFYDNHISMQPPDTPHFQPPVSPQQQQNPQCSTNTHAPSVPSNYKSYKNLNLKQLLMRARAGMSVNSEDVQKQAHLGYFLGEVYAEKKMFKQALKFHRRYLGLAKSMEDFVGMGLGANRVAIDYYNIGQVQKSVIFHNENLKLSSNDNCFAGFYNIGICYRKLGKLNDALDYFESALSWAQEKGQQQSQCIALGQIAVTLLSLSHHEQSLNKFQQSICLCKKLKKSDLLLDNFRYILRVCAVNPAQNQQQKQLKSKKQIQDIVVQAFSIAKQIGNLSMLDIFRCNIGIVRGIQCMAQHRFENNMVNDANQIQEIA